jgi:hypothetical protein
MANFFAPGHPFRPLSPLSPLWPSAPPPELPPIARPNWLGFGGRTYESQLYLLGTAFKAIAGVYIFVAPRAGTWYAVYVGETGDFCDRLTDNLSRHHQYAPATQLGATHVCVIPIPGIRTNRLAVEADLRRSLNPPLNEQ